ncbi:MAG: AraC family transcriptional regulator [Neolewinella sp.]|jgi:AraC family transcriptional regulator
MIAFQLVVQHRAAGVLTSTNFNLDALGSYAVFDYQGLAKDFGLVAAQVFGEWLPAANLTVDNTRPHFEYLPPGYRMDDPEAKEEIWIPVVT